MCVCSMYIKASSFKTSPWPPLTLPLSGVSRFKRFLFCIFNGRPELIAKPSSSSGEQTVAVSKLISTVCLFPSVVYYSTQISKTFQHYSALCATHWRH